jgi:hypothetical protein
MPHLRPRSSSAIARTIDGDVGNNNSDFMLNPCEVENDYCRLASGIETLFVSMTLHYLVGYLKSHRQSVNYERLFFIPSLSAENSGGFDLSIGPSSHRPRIRIMHKVLYGKKINRWCDEKWSWRIKNTRRDGHPVGDYRHLGDLVDNYRLSGGEFKPYLVLHVCYCVHEYRRMGMILNGIRIPNFSSPLRTIIIDLCEIADNINQAERTRIYNSNEFELVVSKSIPEIRPNESEQEFINRSASPVMFECSLWPIELKSDLHMIFIYFHCSY